MHATATSDACPGSLTPPTRGPVLDRIVPEEQVTFPKAMDLLKASTRNEPTFQ